MHKQIPRQISAHPFQHIFHLKIAQSTTRINNNNLSDLGAVFMKKSICFTIGI